MSKLIILRGNSGSGKTTVAKALQEKLGPNTMLISHDMVRLQMLHVWGREGVERSLPLMEALLKYGKAHSDVTVMEGILPWADYKGLFDTAAKEFGDEIFAYYYDISFEETLRRHSTKPNKNDFTAEDMRRWWREKDLLENIEEKIITADMSAGDATQMILRDMDKE